MKISVKENFQNNQNNIDNINIDKIESNYDSIKNSLIIVINILLVSFFIIFLSYFVRIFISLYFSNKNPNFTIDIKKLIKKYLIFSTFICLFTISFIIFYMSYFNNLINKFFEFNKIKFKNLEDIKKLESIDTVNFNILLFSSITFIICIIIYLIFYHYYCNNRTCTLK